MNELLTLKYAPGAYNAEMIAMAIIVRPSFWLAIKMSMLVREISVLVDASADATFCNCSMTLRVFASDSSNSPNFFVLYASRA